MPKKRHHQTTYKPGSSITTSSPSSTGGTETPRKSVNELLANLRRTSLVSPTSPAAPNLPNNSPSVPPSLREILQIPETPSPPPRRLHRPRYDDSGRRLPAGPPPPRSWVRRRAAEEENSPSGLPHQRSIQRHVSDHAMPGVYVPEAGSLVDMLLRSLVVDWTTHREYNYYYLYHIPNHLKPPLIRYLGVVNGGTTLADLRCLLVPPETNQEGAEDPASVSPVAAVGSSFDCLDLTGSVGRSISLKQVFHLLYPAPVNETSSGVQESWDDVTAAPAVPRSLIPKLTRLSLALRAGQSPAPSWRQLLHHAPKLSAVTHLSLAYWPAPCLTPKAVNSSIESPTGRRIPYGGTSTYSHSLDHEWSEALLVLRLFGKSLYKLEFLDLTGCASWFRALTERSGHDHVDWVGNWGKIGTLRLYTGMDITPDSLPSERIAFREAVEVAASVERHIVACRGGKGRIVNVERDSLDE